MPYAGCVSTPVEVFHPDPNAATELVREMEARALAVCATCPVTVECRDWVMERELRWARGERPIRRYGVYGALTAIQRDQLFTDTGGR